MDSVISKYYDFSVIFTKILYLNILWVLFTILGLGVFGIMPATIAMFSVTRKWALNETDIAIFPTFWEAYKTEFFKANGYGLFFLGTGYVLLVAYAILGTQTGLPYLISSYIILGLLLLLLIGLIYFFPIYTHFALKPLQHIKWPIQIGLSHPLLTFFLVVGTTILGYLGMRYLPALMIFLGASVFAYIISWGVAKIYPFYSTANAVTEKNE